MEHDTSPPRLLDVAAVSRRIGRSTRWVWAAAAEQKFPKPVRLSARCTRWDSRAVDRWIEQQLATAE